ncbi:hypothetical protein C479_12599 [Halovivax asiaticus JCM 14624]|uniref:Uncharacterized protein n=1 Tax=Halovivax asiaticus JCM 14624 TaxID=1227490 RepID=M0BDJ4_9EURY|nr:hypothetical protein [Halovivax asiaticus]ELZ08966.1 hypothetical protein C479_12599 [Halovivax asiaticus JCM 14624]
MSDTDSMTEVVVEEATNQFDVDGLVGGESLGEQVDSAEVGRAVGARLGEAAGRRVGAAIGRRVQEALDTIDESAGPRDILADLATAVSDGLSDALSESRERGSALATVVDAARDAGLGSTITDAIGGESGAADVADGDEPEDVDDESASGDDVESETASEEDADTSEVSVPDAVDAESLDVDDLDSLKTETLEAYLQSISYRDLQSIAKDVGVTANITHEEMVGRIVDAVTDDGDESE